MIYTYAILGLVALVIVFGTVRAVLWAYSKYMSEEGDSDESSEDVEPDPLADDAVDESEGIDSEIEDDADPDPRWSERSAAWVRSTASTTWEWTRAAAGTSWAILTSFRAKIFYALVAIFAVAMGVLYLSYQWNGLFNTVLYACLFLFSLTILPILIAIGGAGFPGSGALGKFHIILGAFAFGHHYLVQRDDRWEWCPGDEDRIWIDEEWHAIEAGFEHKSILGWRPFGICRYKGDDRAFQEDRVDVKARKQRREPQERDATATDGGESQPVEMGGYQVRERPEISGVDTWLLDLRRVMSRGVRKIGDIGLVETAEEIIERGEVSTSRMEGYRPMITFLISLVLGVLTAIGYTYMTAGGSG